MISFEASLQSNATSWASEGCRYISPLRIKKEGHGRRVERKKILCSPDLSGLLVWKIPGKRGGEKKEKNSVRTGQDELSANPRLKCGVEWKEILAEREVRPVRKIRSSESTLKISSLLGRGGRGRREKGQRTKLNEKRFSQTSELPSSLVSDGKLTGSCSR